MNYTPAFTQTISAFTIAAMALKLLVSNVSGETLKFFVC